MHIHFIAIGGSAMHNLAIALHLKGEKVTGSDDEIFEPSNSRLKKHGLLPENIGWDASKITNNIDAIVLGMHARADNPELLKAQELGIKIYSYPEYLYEQSKDKTRIVIGGSHGKTTITSMILHVLNQSNIKYDYMVGAQLEGFDVMVKLSNDAKYIVLEGDEYLTSPIDRRPKFHLYMPHIAVISGIAWDHINVFPTFENYVEQFSIFANLIADNGSLVYCTEDKEVEKVALGAKNTINKLAYAIPKHKIVNKTTYIIDDNKEYKLEVFGKHNLMNIEAARNVCNAIGIDNHTFYNAISSFKGASKRLELVKKSENTNIYKDFAHSPSKLKATIQAVKEQFQDRQLIACMELHTFSSLNEKFLEQYHGAMENADVAYVYFNFHSLEHKKLPFLSPEKVKESFGGNNIEVYTDSKQLMDKIKSYNWNNKNLLLMSSGNFDGVDFKQLADELI